jgi:hypothetical protein
MEFFLRSNCEINFPCQVKFSLVIFNSMWASTEMHVTTKLNESGSKNIFQAALILFSGRSHFNFRAHSFYDQGALVS